VLKGRHRQVVDAYEANSGFPLAFAYTFLAPNAGAATAVVVLRHGAFPIALGNEMWGKYKIGEAFKILDPETKARRSRIHSCIRSLARFSSTIWRPTGCWRTAR
jgi:hypothetical protein